MQTIHKFVAWYHQECQRIEFIVENKNGVINKLQISTFLNFLYGKIDLFKHAESGNILISEKPKNLFHFQNDILTWVLQS